MYKILANSGFKLTKWSSNASQTTKTFPESKLSPNHKNLNLTKPKIERVAVQKTMPSNKTWNHELC